MKRIMALGLAAAMAIAIAGCTAQPQATATQGTTATPQPTQEATATPQAETVHMKSGDVYRVLLWNTTKENEPLEGDSDTAEDLRELVYGMQDKYGITITYVKASGWNWLDDAKAGAASGDPICEILHAGQPGALPGLYAHGGQQGAILTNITALGLEGLFANSEFWSTDAIEAAGRYNGSMYFVIPNSIGFNAVGYNQVTIFNVDLMKKAGYSKEQLFELCDNGQWTFDKLREACIAANDPDNSIYGMCLGASSVAMCSMVASNGGKFITKVDGIDRFTGNDDKVVKAIDFFVNMAAVDKTVYMNEYTDDEVAGFAEGKYALMLTYANRLPSIYGQEPAFTYGVLMPPKGPDATDYISEVNWYDGWCVMGNIANPAGAVQCMSQLLAPKYGITSPENLQMLEAQATKYVSDSGSLNNLKKAIDKSFATTYQTYCWLSSNDTGFGFGNAILYCAQSFVDGSLTPGSYYPGVVDAANQLIDMYFAVKK